MSNKPNQKESDKQAGDIPQMPFNDALKRILSAPPQHKTAKKPNAKPEKK